jgi:hypothetical protein
MFKKLITASAVAFALVGTAQADTKVINIGPAVGPTAIYAQSFAKNLKLPNEFVTAKDCGSAVKMVEGTKDSVFLLPHDLITTARKLGDKCWETIDPKQVIVFSEAYYDICKLPDNKTTLRTPGVKVGRASVHPVKEWGDDFNAQNNTSVVSIGLPSSRFVLQAILSRDLDYGVVVRSMSAPAIKAGQIECPFSTDETSDRALSKSFKMKVNNFPLSNMLVANTSDPAVLADLRQAAKSEAFQNFLREGETAYSTTNATDADVKRFKKAVDELYLYIK